MSGSRIGVPKLVAVVAMVGSLLAPSAARAASSYLTVDDDLACPGATFTSIQAAIDAADPGDTVVVCAGEYAEQLTITKSVIVFGAGSLSTVIREPAALRESRCGPSGSGVTAIVEVCGGEGVLAYFLDITVAGTASGPCGSLDFGVLAVGDAEAFGYFLHVLDIRDQTTTACPSGVAIQAGSIAWGETGRFATSGGLGLSGYQREGVVVEGVGSWIDLSGSPEITGMGSSARQPQTGVHVGEGAGAYVDGLTRAAITDHVCDPSVCSGTSVGVEIVDPQTNPEFPSTILTHADVSTNDVGVLVAANGLTNPSPVTISQSDIRDNGIGLLVADDQPDDDVTMSVSGFSNRVTGNSVGVRNTTAVPVDFRRNWWGDPTGPSDWSIGTGDPTSAGVQFFPWSVESDFTTMRSCDLTGSKGADLLTGTAGSDIICGQKGDDKIVGFGGSDLLLGGGGDDVIKGGAGNDALLGGNGADTLKGHAGFDSLQGDAALDLCVDADAGQSATCP